MRYDERVAGNRPSVGVPVSYTHLDVYKRQERERLTDRQTDRIGGFINLKTDTKLVNEFLSHRERRLKQL